MQSGNPIQLAREYIQRGDVANALSVLEETARQHPNSMAVAFELGRMYATVARFAEAKEQFERAAQWRGPEVPTQLALGYALGELGDWSGAARAMLTVLKFSPTNIDGLGSLSECALRLAKHEQAKPPSAAKPISQRSGKISFIVCSIDQGKRERLETNLESLLGGEDWELILIDDARSLSEGYNRGFARCRGEIVVFCHDDIEILCEDFVTRLRSHLASFDVIGIAGSTLASGPTWTWSGPPHIFCTIAYPRLETERGVHLATCGVQAPVVPGAQILDGVFMAARRGIAERLPFDEQTFDGFHLYDLDFSYRAWQSGAKTAVIRDIAICHQSRGNFKNESHKRYSERYRKRNFHKHALWSPIPTLGLQRS